MRRETYAVDIEFDARENPVRVVFAAVNNIYYVKEFGLEEQDDPAHYIRKYVYAYALPDHDSRLVGYSRKVVNYLQGLCKLPTTLVDYAGDMADHPSMELRAVQLARQVAHYGAEYRMNKATILVEPTTEQQTLSEVPPSGHS